MNVIGYTRTSYFSLQYRQETPGHELDIVVCIFVIFLYLKFNPTAGYIININY